MSQYEDAAIAVWSSFTLATALTTPSALKQHNWDKPVVDAELNRLLASGDRCRILAASSKRSSDWLNALLILSCGLRLSDEAVRVAVGLRLGTPLCIPYQCPCGA